MNLIFQERKGTSPSLTMTKNEQRLKFRDRMPVPKERVIRFAEFIISEYHKYDIPFTVRGNMYLQNNGELCYIGHTGTNVRTVCVHACEKGEMKVDMVAVNNSIKQYEAYNSKGENV